MARLPKYTLTKDEKRNDWPLVNDSTNRVVKRFDIKADATAGGALERAVGKDGGSVKIQKENGRFQEERTYPAVAIRRNPRASLRDRLRSLARASMRSSPEWVEILFVEH